MAHTRMSGDDRRAQLLDIAAREFAAHGLQGASIDDIAREAGITQPYVFRIFGTKKALFLELVTRAFDGLTTAMVEAADGRSGLDALSDMGAQYFDRLTDETALRLQLQGFAACGDAEVRDTVRRCFGEMWSAIDRVTGLEPVTLKAFLAFGMLLNTGAALGIGELDDAWATGVRTHIRPGLFAHITSETNR